MGKEIYSDEESSDSEKVKKKKKKKKKKSQSASEDEAKFGFDSDGDEAEDVGKVQAVFTNMKISGPPSGKQGTTDISFDTETPTAAATSAADPFGDFQSSPQNDLFGPPVPATAPAGLFGQSAPAAVQATAAPKPTVAADDDDWLTNISAAPASSQNKGTDFFDTSTKVTAAQQPDFFSADFMKPTNQPERKVDNSMLDFGLASQPAAMKPVGMSAQPAPQPVAQQPVAIEKPKKNDAWGLGDGLVNLTNLSKADNKYAAFDPNSKSTRPNHMLPNLSTAPQQISFTSFNSNMPPNPMMAARGRMPPNQQMLGRAPQPQVGMGMQYG